MHTHQHSVQAPDLSAHGLWPNHDPALDALRQRLTQAGCVFEFAVCLTDTALPASEDMHRQALHVLHAQVLRSRGEHAQAVRLRHPELNFEEKPLR